MQSRHGSRDDKAGVCLRHVQAQGAADLADYEGAQELWVKAQLPHQALAMLRAADRWPDALAFAQQHLPEQVGTYRLHAGNHSTMLELIVLSLEWRTWRAGYRMWPARSPQA